jgi:UDPglucose 6-dehydrogenase
MKIADVGMGFVGLTLAAVYSKKFKVFGIENNKEKLKNLKLGNLSFFEPHLSSLVKQGIASGNLVFLPRVNDVFEKLDFIFVTVGTPTVKGKIDLQFVKSTIKQIGKCISNSKNKPIIVIKSTIAPETTEKIILPLLEKHSGKKEGKDFYVATNPEFLREGSAVQDQIKPHVIVVGYNDNFVLKKTKNLFLKIHDKSTPIHFTNFATSELIKYSNNAFLATKISFINSIANLCQKIQGANVDEIAKIIGMDPRIGSMFLKAGPGYGGSCLPKDLSSLISVYKNHQLEPKFFKGVKDANEKQIKVISTLVEKKLNKIKKPTVSILGLSFKENSDDIRESRSLYLIKKLLKLNYQIKVHDPMALEHTRKVFLDTISYCDNITDCLTKSDCAVIMTPWDQYRKLSKEFLLMKNKHVIDTRRILNDKSKLDYLGIGIN